MATVFGESFTAFLEENPDDARSIINKVLLALKARKAAKAAKDSVLRKGALEGMTLPGKLADCQTKSAEEAGQKPFVYQKAKRALSKFKSGELEKLSRELLVLYHEGHMGKGDINLTLEKWVLNV